MSVYMGQPNTVTQAWVGNGQQVPAYVRPVQQIPQIPTGYQYDGSYGQMPQPAPQMSAMEFVESRDVAEAYRRPPNWPPNTPIPLWDGEHGYVYFKSWSPIGMANPLVRARVIFDQQEPQQPVPISGNSGPAEPQQEYATKADFEQLEQRMLSMMQRMLPQQPVQPAQVSQQNQNGTNQNRNGGGRNG